MNQEKTDILQFSTEERALATRQLLEDAGVVNASSDDVAWAEKQISDNFDIFLEALKKAKRLQAEQFVA